MIIEMEDVTLIDMTGLVAMKTMILDAQNKNMAVILCGSTNITDRILQVLPLSSRHKLKVAKTNVKDNFQNIFKLLRRNRAPF